MHRVSTAITKTTKVLNPCFSFFRGLYELKPQNSVIFWWYTMCANCFKQTRQTSSGCPTVSDPVWGALVNTGYGLGSRLRWHLLNQTASFYCLPPSCSIWIFFLFLFFREVKNEKNVCHFFTGKQRTKVALFFPNRFCLNNLFPLWVRTTAGHGAFSNSDQMVIQPR